MNRDIQSALGTAAGGQSQEVKRVAVAWLAREQFPQLVLTFHANHGINGTTQQIFRGLPQQGFGVFARLQNTQVRQAQHQQRAMSLHTTGRLHRFTVAVGQRQAVAFDAVRMVLKGRLGRQISGIHGTRFSSHQ